MEEVHAVCFAKLCKVIGREMIIGKKVMKMTDLYSLYSAYHSETPFANFNYWSEKIKSISNNHQVYRNKLCFVSLGKILSQYQSDLVFSNETDHLGQNLCWAATKGQWKLLKHILVCMTLHHLFWSAKLSI